MLETEEVDDDYFTPLASTSLSNIFGNSSPNEEGTENESLKYTPPSEQSISKPTSKVTKCIFACAMFAYEWTENDYTAKGKIGFAIINVMKHNSHDIVLYNSNKTTLSSTTVTSGLEVTIKGNLYMSYYDNHLKYWSICATKHEIQKVIEILEGFNVNVRYSSDTDKGPPEPNIIENEKYTATCEPVMKDQESDTDSLLNRKTKDSILNRMANMGQSVLPRYALSTEKTSDSSDTNESSSPSKTFRHKPTKNIIKRVNTNVTNKEIQNIVETHQKLLIPTTIGNTVNAVPLYTYANGQLVPLGDTNLVASSGGGKMISEINVNEMIISEQRISNSELRINMGKLSDRVDQIFDKVKDTDKSNTASNFQIEILQKLMTEYENKIKAYEQIITLKTIDSNNIAALINIKECEKSKPSEIELCMNKISKLDEVIVEKDKEITKLSNEIKLMKEKSFEISNQNSIKESKLLKEIMDLKHSIILQQEEMMNISSNFKNNTLLNTADSGTQVACKLKSVMNETFRAISVNFDNNECYSGTTIKSVIAAVIKEVTMDTLAFR